MSNAVVFAGPWIEPIAEGSSDTPHQEFLGGSARFLRASPESCCAEGREGWTTEDYNDKKTKRTIFAPRDEVAKECDMMYRLEKATWWSSDELISLNVGGEVFTTSYHTLCAVPNSMLALLPGSWFNMERDAAGSIFLDSSPHLFREILSYLRLKLSFQTQGREATSPLSSTVVQRAKEEHDEALHRDEEAIAAQLVQTSWRHMTSAQLRALVAEAKYYNLKNLQTQLLSYCQRRWIEYGTFVPSCEESIGGKEFFSPASPLSPSSAGSLMDAVLCIAYDDKSGVCAIGRGSGAVMVYFLPSLVRYKVLYGHTSCVTAVVVTPTRIFSSGRDGFIWVWHNHDNSFSFICNLRAHQGFANSILFLSDQSSLLSCGMDSTINIFRVTQECCRLVTAGAVATPGPVQCLLADRQYVFAACGDVILVLDVIRRELLPHRGVAQHGPIRCLAVSEHNGLLASGGWDGALYVWSTMDVASDSYLKSENSEERIFTPLYMLARYNSWVTHLIFLGGFLGVSSGSTIHFFDLDATPRVVRSIRQDGDALVRVFLAVEQVNCLLVGNFDGTFSALHNCFFAERGAKEEKACQWEGSPVVS